MYVQGGVAGSLRSWKNPVVLGSVIWLLGGGAGNDGDDRWRMYGMVMVGWMDGGGRGDYESLGGGGFV